MSNFRIFSVGILLLGMACSGPPSLPSTINSADGTNIAFDIHGDDGPAVVLVHGWSNNRTFFDPHLPMLSQDHRVVTMDLAGFGESGESRSAWTMESFGQDVVAVVNALELNEPVLVGFSMGGAAVLEAASSLGGGVGGVVLVDIFQNVNQRYDAELIAGIVEPVKETWHDFEAVRGYIGPNAPDSLVQRYIDKTPTVVPDHWWEAINEFFVWADAELIPTIQSVSAPIGAINAPETPTDVEAFRVHSPSFEATVIPEVGHIGVVWMKPDLFVESLRGFVQGMVGSE